MQTDLMWINRHSIIIGLQSQEHDAESNFNAAVIPVLLRYTEFCNFDLVFLFLCATHFFLFFFPFCFSIRAPFLYAYACILLLRVLFDVFYYDFIGSRRHYNLNHM